MVDESNDAQMRDQQGGNAQGCCGGGDDCGSGGASGGGCCGGGGKSWKTALFVLVLVLAGVVAAHSILTGDQAGPATEPVLPVAEDGR